MKGREYTLTGVSSFDRVSFDDDIDGILADLKERILCDGKMRELIKKEV